MKAISMKPARLFLNRKTRWLAAFVLLGLTVALPFSLVPREKLLLERATQIPKAGNWEWRRSNPQWLTNDQLYLTSTYYGSPDIHCAILDTRTGKLHYLTGVNKRLRKVSEWLWRDCQISPDRQWLLEHDREGTSVMHLDGTGLQRIEDAGRFAQVYWLSDSRRWLHVYCGSYGHSPPSPELTLYSRDGRVEELTNPLQNPLFLSGTMAVGICQNTLITFQANENNEHKVENVRVFKRRLETQDAHSETFSFALHQPGFLCEAAFSPLCDRVAWIIKSDYRPSLRVLMHRFFPSVKVPVYRRMSLWSSRINGQDQHEVGHLDKEIVSDDDVIGDGWDGPLLWLPDGKRLSFIHKETLYTVPTD